ncbi:MAG: hypothetical protein JOS17DRAFT_731102 [Linnemannia elongata]|nr:MAG: hypothetical protein JOS17DRAFT_731102 [Linnemannia elongata]
MKSWILFMNLFSLYTFFFAFSLCRVVSYGVLNPLFFLIHLFCLSPFILFIHFLLTLCYFFFLFVMTPPFRTIVPQQRTTFFRSLPSFRPLVP